MCVRAVYAACVCMLCVVCGAGAAVQLHSNEGRASCAAHLVNRIGNEGQVGRETESPGPLFVGESPLVGALRALGGDQIPVQHRLEKVVIPFRRRAGPGTLITGRDGVGAVAHAVMIFAVPVGSAQGVPAADQGHSLLIGPSHARRERVPDLLGTESG